MDWTDTLKKPVQQHNVELWLEELIPMLEDLGIKYEEIPDQRGWKVFWKGNPFSYFPTTNKIQFHYGNEWYGGGRRIIIENIEDVYRGIDRVYNKPKS